MGQQHVMREHCFCWCSINSISGNVTYDVYTGFAIVTEYRAIYVLKISLSDISNNELSSTRPTLLGKWEIQRRVDGSHLLDAPRLVVRETHSFLRYCE